MNNTVDAMHTNDFNVLYVYTLCFSSGELKTPVLPRASRRVCDGCYMWRKSLRMI